MKKVINGSTGSQHRLDRIISEVLGQMDPTYSNMINPLDCKIIDLGDGTTGVVYEEGSNYTMVRISGPFDVYLSADELVQAIVDTWTD